MDERANECKAADLTSLGLWASFHILLVMKSSLLWPWLMKSAMPSPIVFSFA